MLRSIDNWESKPGNIDCLNIYTGKYESSNKYQIPDLLDTPFIPEGLVPYDTQVKRRYAQVKGKCVHFFLDDYKFESLWNKPIKTLPPIQALGQAISPDFTIDSEYPLALNIWQVYRSRWLARFWQENNIDVIPNVTWADESSYDYCFLGIPKHSSVAIGTIGINSKQKKEEFKKGFEKMVEVLEPKNLIVYGETMPVEFAKYCDNVYTYPSYWKVRRRELKDKNEGELNDGYTRNIEHKTAIKKK